MQATWMQPLLHLPPNKKFVVLLQGSHGDLFVQAMAGYKDLLGSSLGAIISGSIANVYTYTHAEILYGELQGITRT